MSVSSGHLEYSSSCLGYLNPKDLSLSYRKKTPLQNSCLITPYSRQKPKQSTVSCPQDKIKLEDLGPQGARVGLKCSRNDEGQKSVPEEAKRVTETGLRKCSQRVGINISHKQLHPLSEKTAVLLANQHIRG